VCKEEGSLFMFLVLVSGGFLGNWSWEMGWADGGGRIPTIHSRAS